MPRVILTCGRICAGKSTYAEKLARDICAVIFSVDEITLLLLGQNAGERLGEYVEKLEAYFLEKSAETAANGVNVILDIGLWTRAERDGAREFFRKRGISCEIHYIAVPADEWKRRVAARNEAVRAGRANAYYVDEGLAEKAEGLFEEPAADEETVTVHG